MGLTRVSGDVIQSTINVGVVTATRIDGNVSGDINSTGVSTFSTLKVGTGVTISGGIVTATTFSGNLTGNLTGNVSGNVTGNATGLSGTPNITVGAITASSAVISGNISVAGTVTYEDTTNVDSIGVITARSGIVIGTGASISSSATNVLTLGTNNSERVRIDSGGRIITGNYSTALDTTAGSIVVNGDTSGGRIVTRGSSTSADASLGEFFGFWDTNKVAGIIFSSGSDTTNKDDGTIKFYTSSDGPSVTERLRINSNGNINLNLPSNTTSRHYGITNTAGTIGWTFGNGVIASSRQFVLYDNEAGAARFIVDSSGHFKPGADNTYDLGASGTRWRNIYTADLQMSNEGSANDVDGTWGKYTIQEGENDLFLINRRTGKRYKFLLEEVK